MEKTYESLKKSQNKILCLGKNYLKHALEMGGKGVPSKPVVFSKPWSSIVTEPNPIKIITLENHHIEHEIELGFVLSKTAKNVKKEDFKEYIKAYFLCLDLTDRTFQNDSKKSGLPWFFAKGQDNFLPISRPIDPNLVKDPYNIDINFYINEQIKQSGNTKEMHFKIGDILEYITKYVTLNEGDLILTGTPEGVGPIKVGDKLYGNLKQNDKILVEMSFLVEEKKLNSKF
jgi:acylpyruvate hydrolase